MVEISRDGADAGLYSYALLALAALLPDDSCSPEAGFLRARSMIVGGDSWPQYINQLIESPACADRPLLELAQKLSLDRIEVLATTLAAAVEVDPMCGRAIAHLQAPVGGSRPTLGLLATAFREFSGERQVIERLMSGAAVQSGLLLLLNENAPLAERAVAVPVPLSLALRGSDAAWPGTSLGLSGVPATPLPPSVVAEAKRRAAGLSYGSQKVLVLRSGSLAEGKTVATEIASALRCRALFVNLDRPGGAANLPPALVGLGPLLLLRQLLPVFCVEPGPGDRKSTPVLPHYSAPALVLSGSEGSIEANGESPPVWSIGVPPRAERDNLWRLAIGNSEAVPRLATDYRYGSGRIAQLGRLARQQSTLDGRSSPAFSDVAAATWIGEGSGLDAFAQPLADLISDEAFVAGPALREELSRLLLRCRSRESLVEGLGASALARYRSGVRVLFTGPSGTGKTLAASWLATQLGLPLYRADLASITSKYIGETEKNLAQLLARAEASGIILLFDEADSLFGKRTEVKESNDRFANAQTNYLLQRIETFDGITILTSNSRARFDSAFCRRLDLMIEFPLPSPEERRLLWLSHLGAHHRLTHRELNQLASVADLAGGHIRNAVLTAAMLARTKRRPIQIEDVQVSLTDEYRKLGRQLPVALGHSI